VRLSYILFFPWRSRRWQRQVEKEKHRLALSLAFMAAGGLPLADTLQAQYLKGTPRIFRNREQRRIAGLVGSLEDGESLSGALKARPGDFRPWEAALVEAGERSQDLPGALLAWADLLSTTFRLRSEVRSLLAYPTTVLAIFFGVVSIIFWKIMPTMKALLRGSGQEPPLLMQLMVEAARYFWIGFWVAFLFALVLGGLFRLARGIPWLRPWRDRLVLAAPFAGALGLWRGRLITLEVVAGFLAAGSPLHEGVRHAAAAQPNWWLRRELDRTAAILEDGDSLPAPVRGKIFNRRTTWGLRCALARPDAAEACRRLAERETAAFEHHARRQQLWYEAAWIFFLGALLGLVVMAVYLTLFQVSTMTVPA